ncbi:MAG: HspR, transcriptional repressor of DnaK operon, partial [uncultured Nocardioides sp.]
EHVRPADSRRGRLRHLGGRRADGPAPADPAHLRADGPDHAGPHGRRRASLLPPRPRAAPADRRPHLAGHRHRGGAPDPGPREPAPGAACPQRRAAGRGRRRPRRAASYPLGGEHAHQPGARTAGPDAEQPGRRLAPVPL